MNYQVKTYTDYLDIIRKHQLSYPVHLMPLAEELGIKIYETHSWDDNISGMIKKSPEYGGESGYACFVNAKHSSTRKRFTIAHEMAHFILHKELIGDGISDDALFRSRLSNSIEAQANRLAAEILMPWKLIKQAIQEGKENIPDLAKLFDVSESAMSVRLKIPDGS